MGSRSTLVSIPCVDVRELGYWRAGGALVWSCHHGKQALPHSSALYNLRAHHASRALKMPKKNYDTREGGSLHLTDMTQSKLRRRRCQNVTRESSAGSAIAWVAQATRGAINVSLLTSSSTGVRAESLLFPTSRRVKQQCMQCVK